MKCLIDRLNYCPETGEMTWKTVLPHTRVNNSGVKGVYRTVTGSYTVTGHKGKRLGTHKCFGKAVKVALTHWKEIEDSMFN